MSEATLAAYATLERELDKARAEVERLKAQFATMTTAECAIARQERDEAIVCMQQTRAYAMRLYRAARDLRRVRTANDREGLALDAVLGATPESVKVAAERAAVDAALHPAGRCECFGEGRCAWCVKRDAEREP